MFLVYNPVVGALIPGGADSKLVEAHLNAARTEVGEATWKRGNTLGKPDGPTVLIRSKLNAGGITFEPVRGALQSVNYAETSDGVNTYNKVRVRLGSSQGDSTTISVDVQSEVGERLIQKLANCKRGQHLTISAFAMAAADGRPYVNHVVSIKDETGAEVPNVKGVYTKVKESGVSVEAALRAAKLPEVAIKEAVIKAKRAASFDAHKALALEVSERFAHTVSGVPA